MAVAYLLRTVNWEEALNVFFIINGFNAVITHLQKLFLEKVLN